jgi:hypothetical protein
MRIDNSVSAFLKDINAPLAALVRLTAATFKVEPTGVDVAVFLVALGIFSQF